MADKDGKKTGGRIAGTPNKRNQHIADLAEELDCDPARILMFFAKGDYASLGYEEFQSRIVGKGDNALLVDELTISPELRKASASDLMPYLHGKRKPVDSTGDDSSDLFSLLLEAVDGNK